MPPEILAWALLFVVAFGIVYRFFSWLGRRIGGASSVVTAPHEAKAIAAAAVERPLQVSAPRPLRETAPLPAPASDYAVPVSPASNEPATPPLRAREQIVAPSVKATEPDASMSPHSAAAAALATHSPSPRTTVAPSVAATLPPPPPFTAAQSLSPRRFNDPADELRSSPPAPTSTSDAGKMSSPAISAEKASALRAYRMRTEVPALDIRLKDARDRKIRTVPKASRKPADFTGAKEMKVLTPRPAVEISPTRRIGRKTTEGSVLASAKARTRIVGVAQRASRVLTMTGL